MVDFITIKNSIYTSVLNLFEDKNSLPVLAAQILNIHSGQKLDKQKPINKV